MARLDRIRNAFETKVSEAGSFVSRCATARRVGGNRPALIAANIEWAHEVALLKVMVASERFFELALGLYVIGERTTSGYRPRRIRRIESTLPSILDAFRGDQNFIGWNDPSDIAKRAERWLRNGEPFQTTLSAAGQLLKYLKTMRNAIAHSSDSALEKYANATRSLYGATPKQVSPGIQLGQPPPTAIPYLAGATLFEASMQAYRLIASQIVR